MADSTLAIKAFAIIMAIAFVASALILIDTNNKYRDLTDRYSSQSTQIAQLQSKLNQTEASLQSLNTTLTNLANNPLVKAATTIISRVGVDYFNTYFHDPTVETDVNFTKVEYKYHIVVDGYTVDRDVTFYVYSNRVFKYGLPVEGNLQPFNVSKEEAIQLALNVGLPSSNYPLEAEIHWDSNTDIRPLPPYADKYVWVVTSWSDPPWAWTRTERHALVDPNTGQVYVIHSGGSGLVESQVDTAAEAKALGIDGYVKLEYPKLPQQIQIVKGGNYTFTIRATFTSYNSSLQEVKLIVDPHYVDPYQIQSNMADKVREVLSYEPGGIITLRVGETVNITATVRVPDDVGQVYFFHRWALNGLGIGADGVLFLSDLEA